MLSAKQGSIWYHFYHVCGITQLGIKPTSSCSWGECSYHWANAVLKSHACLSCLIASWLFSSSDILKENGPCGQIYKIIHLYFCIINIFLITFLFPKISALKVCCDSQVKLTLCLCDNRARPMDGVAISQQPMWYPCSQTSESSKCCNPSISPMANTPSSFIRTRYEFRQEQFCFSSVLG